jgi:hypothetical protein
MSEIKPHPLGCGGSFFLFLSILKTSACDKPTPLGVGGALFFWYNERGITERSGKIVPIKNKYNDIPVMENSFAIKIPIKNDL